MYSLTKYSGGGFFFNAHPISEINSRLFKELCGECRQEAVMELELMPGKACGGELEAYGISLDGHKTAMESLARRLVDGT